MPVLMPRLAGVLFAFSLAASSVVTAAAQSDASPSPMPDVSSSPVPSPVATSAYPPAPKSTASTNFFGTVVPDPYRPLESIDAPETTAWVRAENAISRSYLDAIPGRTAIAAAYRKLENYPKLGAPGHHGSKYFYSFNTGLQTQYVMYERSTEFGPAHTFFDPNTLSKDGSIQMTDHEFTKDGSLMAYATSTGGEDWRTWHVKNVAMGRDTSDLVHWSKFSGASWDGDRGFFYSAFDAPTTKNKTFGRLTLQKIYFHAIGTPQSRDRLVYTAKPRDLLCNVSTTFDERYDILQLGDFSQQLLWKTRAAPDTAFRPFTPYLKDVAYDVLGNDGSRVYLKTNRDAPRGRVVWIDLDDPAHAVHALVPQGADKLDGATLVGDRLFLAYLHDSHSVIRVETTAGRSLGMLPLPGIGTAYAPYARRDDRIAYFGYWSYAEPYTSYRLDTVTLRSTVYDKPRVAFDESAYITEQRFAHSKDGTRIPIFLTHRKDVVYDGNNPTLLYGYGGFDYAETPYFSTERALWLQMGGVYADVVLRGGGDYGEAWHDAGRLDKKQNVFDDFTAAARYLIAAKVTSTPKLAIDGGSNGGLLVGAMVTQHPNLFTAAIAEQGVLDMLRYEKFTVGYNWVPEYGKAEAGAAQFKYLYAYSPLHNVKPGTAYPATMIMTADHDDRVFPAHSYKFAAALQAAQSGPAPILLRVQTNEGHFSGLTTDESIALYSDFYGFLVKNLDFEPKI